MCAVLMSEGRDIQEVAPSLRRKIAQVPVGETTIGRVVDALAR